MNEDKPYINDDKPYMNDDKPYMYDDNRICTMIYQICMHDTHILTMIYQICMHITNMYDTTFHGVEKKYENENYNLLPCFEIFLFLTYAKISKQTGKGNTQQNYETRTHWSCTVEKAT